MYITLVLVYKDIAFKKKKKNFCGPTNTSLKENQNKHLRICLVGRIEK